MYNTSTYNENVVDVRTIKIDSYTEAGKYDKKITNTIVDDIHKIADIDPAILNQAADLCEQAGFKKARKKRRKYIIFGCVWNAHLQLNRSPVHAKIAKQCDIDIDEITDALKIYSTHGGYQYIASNHVTPSTYIYNICNAIGRRDVSEDIVVILERLLKCKPELLDLRPALVAGGTIYYCCNKMYDFEDVTAAVLSKQTGHTINSITAMAKKIEIFDNSM